MLSSDLAVYQILQSISLKHVKTPSNNKAFTLLLRQREEDVLMLKKNCRNLLLVNLWNFIFLNYNYMQTKVTKIIQLMVLMKVMIIHPQPVLWMKVMFFSFENCQVIIETSLVFHCSCVPLCLLCAPLPQVYSVM